MRSVLTGPSIQVRCLECPSVAAPRVEKKDVGFLSAIAGWLFSFLRLPRITGYIAFGLLCGPAFANLMSVGMARDLFALQGSEFAQLQTELKAIEARLRAWHRANADSRRLAQIPGIGPVGAPELIMKTPDPHAFTSARHFAAWIGLTPKDHSTAGKTRLGKITRAGDERLRSVLVAGATAVIKQAMRGRGHPSPWLVALLKRKPPKLAAVALANKNARIAWKLMMTGESYNGARMQAASAAAT